MEQGNNTKEVYFGKYCGKCKYRRRKENEEPCEECLTNPSNIDSHKPIKFEQGVSTHGKSE